MRSKHDIVEDLRAVLGQWDTLLSGRTEAAITARRLPTDWSISDVVAHLMAWQQVSIARVEAALRRKEPKYPNWLGGADPFFAEDHVNEFNARIHELYRQESWSTVHRSWRSGFLRFLELADAISENELLETGRYPWLNGDALAAVLEGSLQHHREHYESVSARLG